MSCHNNANTEDILIPDIFIACIFYLYIFIVFFIQGLHTVK